MLMNDLGKLDELPPQYREQLKRLNLAPLWPSMRALLPYDRPQRATQPTHWPYRDVRPLLLEAGRLTPIEKAERRVLILANPGLGADSVIATPTIFIGLQLILPGETAPNHKHTPSAIRFVVEGRGAYTTVNGEKCPMEKGDLILTPALMWHEHGHEGSEPVVWLDALDVPLILRMEASYAVAGEGPQRKGGHDASQTRYRRAGLVPYGSLDACRAPFPLLRYPWNEVRAALHDLAPAVAPGAPVQLAYVDPETGEACLPMLGFSALMLRPGEELAFPQRSASMVLHVVEGEGRATVEAVEHRWEAADTMAVPTWADVRLVNGSRTAPAFLFIVDDAPLQRKLGIYQEVDLDQAAMPSPA